MAATETNVLEQPTSTVLAMEPGVSEHHGGDGPAYEGSPPGPSMTEAEHERLQPHLERYFDPTLGDELRAALVKHLRACEECRDWVAQELLLRNR